MVYEVTCECGFHVRGSEQHIVPVVQLHGKQVHEMDVTPEQVMALATPVEK